MGCLHVDVNRIKSATANAKQVCGLNGSADRLGGCKVAADKKNLLNISVYFVCTVGGDKYIRVTPEEPLWITVNQDLTYTIHSNSDWVIL